MLIMLQQFSSKIAHKLFEITFTSAPSPAASKAFPHKWLETGLALPVCVCACLLACIRLCVSHLEYLLLCNTETESTRNPSITPTHTRTSPAKPSPISPTSRLNHYVSSQWTAPHTQSMSSHSSLKLLLQWQPLEPRWVNGNLVVKKVVPH